METLFVSLSVTLAKITGDWNRPLTIIDKSVNGTINYNEPNHFAVPDIMSSVRVVVFFVPCYQTHWMSRELNL